MLENWRQSFIVLAVAVAVAAALVSWIALSHTGSTSQPFTPAQAFSTLWAVIFIVMILGVAVMAATNAQDFFISIVLGATGAALGWIIGIMATPQTMDEARAFGEYKTAIVGFLSGFAASKLSRIFDVLTDSAAGTEPKLFRRGYLLRILLFSSSFFVSLGAQYNIRQYASGSVIVTVDPSKKNEGKIIAQPGEIIQFSGSSSFSEDSGVAWSVSPAGAGTIDKQGLFCWDNQGVKDQVIHVIATSRWNQSRSAQVEVSLDQGGKKQKSDSWPLPCRKDSTAGPENVTSPLTEPKPKDKR